MHRRVPALVAALVVGCSTAPAADDASVAVDAADAASADAPALDAFVAPRPRAAPLSCASAVGSPRDLLPLARLTAGPTRRSGASVREDRDGPMTLRDDDDASGWAPLAGSLATLRIDLGPGLERAVALDTLAFATTGAAPTDVHAYVLEACGGGVVADFAWPDPGTPLSLAGTCGTCVEVDLRGTTGTRVLTVSLSSRDDSVVLPAALPDPPATPPVPPLLESGVIEGFYGPPWSFAERARMIDVMSALGLGTYLYAPKDDPLHRAMWRTPYDAATVVRFGALADVAEARGVRLLFGVSPFLDFDPAVDADYVALETKLATLLDAGVDGVAILADDLFFGSAPVDGALGAMHASVVTRVVADLAATRPGLVVWFVPTVYEDHTLAATPGGSEYLMALRALPPEVRVLWTGTDVGSATLTGADVANVRTLIGRDPLIWDNAWANDVNDMVHGHLVLGTYEGRDDALRAATRGIAANPLVQGSIARLPVGMLAAWLDSDATGDAAREAAAAVEARFLWRPSPGAHDALVRLAETYDGTFTSDVSDRRLAAALGRITTAAASGAPDPADVALALDVFARMATLGSDARHLPLDADLGDELEAPLAALAEDGLAGLALLDVLTARLGGGDPSAAEALVRAHDAASSRASRFEWTTLVPDTLAAWSAVPASDRGLRASTPGATALPTCVVGAPLVVEAFTSGTVRAYGLPGATVAGTQVTFTPPHAGTFDAVITATDASGGVSSRAITLVCVPAR